LRSRLFVSDVYGETVLFRFYDPRVLRALLPTCTSDQLVELFGPVQKYIVEDEDPSYAIEFSLKNRVLMVERIHLLQEPVVPEVLSQPQIENIDDSNTIV
jgi:hypothetical protein